MTVTFGERLRAALDAYGPLCVGIDPHQALLEAWGLPQSADGLRAFGLTVIDAAAGRVEIELPNGALVRATQGDESLVRQVILAAGQVGREDASC